MTSQPLSIPQSNTASPLSTSRLHQMLNDPVHKEPMLDPVMCNDGYTYDRATASHLSISPFTRQPLFLLGPNVALRSEIFEAYPQQLALYREKQLDLRDASRPSSLSDTQLGELSAIHATLDVNLADRDARAAQLGQGLEDINNSQLMARLKAEIVKSGRITTFALAHDLSVSRYGLCMRGYQPKGLAPYLEGMDVNVLPPVAEVLDDVIASLRKVAEKVATRANVESISSDSDNDSF